MDDADIIFLDDSVTQRMVLSWYLVPPELRVTRSISDLADEWAALCGCNTNDVFQRVTALRRLGIVTPDGGVSDKARDYLAMLTAAKVAGMKSQQAPDVAKNHVTSMGEEGAIQWVSNLFKTRPERVRDNKRLSRVRQKRSSESPTPTTASPPLSPTSTGPRLAPLPNFSTLLDEL